MVCAVLQAVVGHPHVVALHAVYEDINNLHMIMDWCGGGSLWQLMERCPGYMLPEAAAAAATKAVLEVLAHCHARCAACMICNPPAFATLLLHPTVGCKSKRWSGLLQAGLHASCVNLCCMCVCWLSAQACWHRDVLVCALAQKQWRGVSAIIPYRQADKLVVCRCVTRGVMHRDIKPDNLLVAKPLVDPQQLTADDIKVTDFGISVPFTPGQVG